jgi:hypothetical protein
MEHACDTRTLIKHLKTVKSATKPWDFTADITIALVNSEEGEADKDMLHLERSYVELALNANGKAELYFHAYLWKAYLEFLITGNDSEKAKEAETYFTQSAALTRLALFSQKPKVVTSKLAQMSFTESEYDLFVDSFSGRQPVKKFDMILKLQRHLFFA